MEALASVAFARLPETFRALCADLVIAVEDFPTDEVLDVLGLDVSRHIVDFYRPLMAALGTVDAVDLLGAVVEDALEWFGYYRDFKKFKKNVISYTTDRVEYESTDSFALYGYSPKLIFCIEIIAPQ